MRLKNKTALITGASSGIGKASALLFAKEGARVVVADINEKEGQATADEIKATGHHAAFVKADVSKAQDLGLDHEYQRQRRIPWLQIWDPGTEKSWRWKHHQYGIIRKPPRCSDTSDCLYRKQRGRSIPNT
jgi:hypothetical protein